MHKEGDKTHRRNDRNFQIRELLMGGRYAIPVQKIKDVSDGGGDISPGNVKISNKKVGPREADRFR
jgi:hypothetical protein